MAAIIHVATIAQVGSHMNNGSRMIDGYHCTKFISNILRPRYVAQFFYPFLRLWQNGGDKYVEQVNDKFRLFLAPFFYHFFVRFSLFDPQI